MRGSGLWSALFLRGNFSFPPGRIQMAEGYDGGHDVHPHIGLRHFCTRGGLHGRPDRPAENNGTGNGDPFVRFSPVPMGKPTRPFLSHFRGPFRNRPLFYRLRPLHDLDPELVRKETGTGFLHRFLRKRVSLRIVSRHCLADPLYRLAERFSGGRTRAARRVDPPDPVRGAVSSPGQRASPGRAERRG